MPYTFSLKGLPKRTVTAILRNPSEKYTTSGARTQDNADLPQALSAKQAILIENYFNERDYELRRRNGSRTVATVAGATPSRVLREWTDTFMILGYGTVLSVFNTNDNTIHTIKSNFSAALTDGRRYGVNFYSCNGRFGDKIYKTTLPSLNFDTQTVNFTVGQVITGGTSGATATLVSQTDAGVTGTLVFDNINGTFQDNETLTDPLGGSALANGVVVYTNTAELSAGSGTVPKCEVLYVMGTRLAAGCTDTDAAEVHLSKENDFTAWSTASTLSGESYTVNDKRFGQLNSLGILNLGAAPYSQYRDLNVAIFESGILGWRVSQQTDATAGVVQIVVFEIQDVTHGGKRGALSTPIGIFYGNDTGEYVLHPSGTSTNISWTFGRTTIAELDPSQADRIYIPEKYLVLIATNKNASANNIMYWFDIRTITQPVVTDFPQSPPLWGTITGLPVGRFCAMGSKLYGAMSLAPRIVDLFPQDIWDDDGSDVYYHYTQPLNIGSMDTIKDLLEQYLAGFLSSNAPITVKFYGYAENGQVQDTLLNAQWGTSGAPGSLLGVSELPVSEGAIGITPAPNGTVWYPATGYAKGYGYNSFILDLSGHDQVPHVISYASVKIKEVRPQRKNLLTPS